MSNLRCQVRCISLSFSTNRMSYQVMVLILSLLSFILKSISSKKTENLRYHVHVPRVALIGFISISNHHHPQQNDCPYQHNTIANNTNKSTRLYNAVDYNVN